MTYIISDNCLQISDSYRYSKHDMIPSLNLIKERYPNSDIWKRRM